MAALALCVSGSHIDAQAKCGDQVCQAARLASAFTSCKRNFLLMPVQRETFPVEMDPGESQSQVLFIASNRVA